MLQVILFPVVGKCIFYGLGGTRTQLQTSTNVIIFIFIQRLKLYLSL